MVRNTIGLRFELYRGSEKVQWHRIMFRPNETYTVNTENAYALLFDMFGEMEQPSVRVTYGQFIDFLHSSYAWIYACSSAHNELLIIWKEYDFAEEFTDFMYGDHE